MTHNIGCHFGNQPTRCRGETSSAILLWSWRCYWRHTVLICSADLSLHQCVHAHSEQVMIYLIHQQITTVGGIFKSEFNAIISRSWILPDNPVNCIATKCTLCYFYILLVSHFMSIHCVHVIDWYGNWGRGTTFRFVSMWDLKRVPQWDRRADMKWLIRRGIDNIPRYSSEILWLYWWAQPAYIAGEEINSSDDIPCSCERR
jgi:hypothetical protein